MKVFLPILQGPIVVDDESPPAFLRVQLLIMTMIDSKSDPVPPASGRGGMSIHLAELSTRP